MPFQKVRPQTVVSDFCGMQMMHCGERDASGGALMMAALVCNPQP